MEIIYATLIQFCCELFKITKLKIINNVSKGDIVNKSELIDVEAESADLPKAAAEKKPAAKKAAPKKAAAKKAEDK